MTVLQNLYYARTNKQDMFNETYKKGQIDSDSTLLSSRNLDKGRGSASTIM